MGNIVYGVGIIDADYVLTKYILLDSYRPDGRRRKQKQVWKCPFYHRWISMLARCYSKRYQDRSPSYKGCTVCDEWLTFSNFRKWMTSQDWEGKQLDKDLLISGNKGYSPETCIFVFPIINTFTTSCSRTRGRYLLGCYWDKRKKKFIGQCSNPFKKRKDFLGLYDSQIEAHLAWKKRKHEYSCQLADSAYIDDDRVKEVLLTKYKNYTIIETHLK